MNQGVVASQEKSTWALTAAPFETATTMWLAAGTVADGTDVLHDVVTALMVHGFISAVIDGMKRLATTTWWHCAPHT